MSWNPLLEPGYPDAVAIDAIETLIVPRAVDLGGFVVRRALPSAQRQMVGPFIFFDHFGPAEIPSRAGSRRASPPPYRARDRHLSLSRRDPASRQRRVETDHPAGRRQLDGRGARHYPFRANARRGAQEAAQRVWASDLGCAAGRRRGHGPELRAPRQGGAASHRRRRRHLRLILGRAYGEAAPAKVFSETVYADAELKPGARMPLPDDHEERGLYILEGSISVAGQAFEAGQMIAFRPKDRISVAAGPKGARLILLGGAPLAGPAISGGISSLRAARRSTPPRSNGAKAIGATASSTFRPTIATNSFRCRRRAIERRLKPCARPGTSRPIASRRAIRRAP